MQADKKVVEIIKDHFTSDAIQTEIENWRAAGYNMEDEQQMINLNQAYFELTGLKL